MDGEKSVYDVPDYEGIKAQMLAELASYDVISLENLTVVLSRLYAASLIGDSIEQNTGGLVVAVLPVCNWEFEDPRVETRYFSKAINKEVVMESFDDDIELDKADFVDQLIRVDQDCRDFESGLIKVMK